ncbi:16S rRNA (cytidine(1402)-2'-O)-methyltransferase [Sandaracinus amylolyticus]|uniref:16S rRNA (cytidine(1402)-2'-O)-methyltransferase n=1 Tax=Sandaracinus amylolyticus TaxID=927083 RepID=UPI001F032C90|nr:16S rRNA (cytidine(1402)-2'-O)-methyltransferase [Sandaracinus amylolyticus]
MSDPGTTRGKLSIVATPIGNLEDITLRALRVMREADVILAEDTRRTSVLCRHHGVGTPLRSFHAHTPAARIEALVEELRGGAKLALVSDAGTPLVSDPGAELVRACAEAGITVEAIPGPSAPIAALVASGLAAPSFEFVGFLPRGGGRRQRALAGIAKARGAVMLFEAPNRIGATLRDLAGVLGGTRQAAVCRELTKLHEEIARGSLDALAEKFAEGTLGEITLVVAAPDVAPEDEKEPVDDETVRAWLDDEGLGTREAADRLAEREGIPRKDAYKRVLGLAGR